MINNSKILQKNETILDAIKELRAEGGGTLYLPPSDTAYNVIASRPKDLWYSNSNVTIESLDPENPAVMGRIVLNKVSNLTFRNLEFDDTVEGSNLNGHDIRVTGSYDITFDNLQMSSLADGFAQSGDHRYSGGMIRNSEDIQIINSEFHDYSFGFSLLDSDRVTYSGNLMTGIQGDGLRIGGGTDVHVLDSVFKDFYSSDQKGYTHSDVIQYWGANTYSPTVGLKISGNFINPGAGTQGIFGHNNHGRENEFRHGFYDFEISDNLLVMGSYQGMTLSDIDGLKVTDNTLLWNEYTTLYDGEGKQNPSSMPWLSFSRTNDSEVEGNLIVRLQNGSENLNLNMGDNIVLTEQDVLDNFVNPKHLAGDSALIDFRLVEGSELDGKYGSSLSWSENAAEGLENAMRIASVDGQSQTYRFDAQHSLYSGNLLCNVDPDATYIWTFDDGTTHTGMVVDKVFKTPGHHDASLTIKLTDGTTKTITRTVEVDCAVLLDINLDEGLHDQSWYGSSVLDRKGVIETGPDGDVYAHITQDAALVIPRGATQEQIYGRDEFSLSFDINASRADSDGYILYGHKKFTIYATTEGVLTLKLRTDSGMAEIISDVSSLPMDGTHRISVSYSSSAALFQLRVDDVVVGETKWTGTTAPQGTQSLLFGATYGRAVLESKIDNIKMVSYATVSDEQIDNVDAYINGIIAAINPIERSRMLQDQAEVTNVIAYLDFEGVAVDLAANGLEVASGKTLSFTDGAWGQGLELTGVKTDGANIKRENDAIHHLDEFTMAANIQMDPGKGGQFINFGKVLQVTANDNGDVAVRFWTEEKQIRVIEKDLLSDGEFHRLAITYSDEQDSFKFYADGELIGNVEISGLTAPKSYHGINFGGSWANSAEGALDDFVMLDHAAEEYMIVEDAEAVAQALQSNAAWAGSLLNSPEAHYLI